MAHYSQEQFALICANHLEANNVNFNKYNVLDVGSYDLNGNLKKFFPKNDYTGVDLVNGPNVDLIHKGEELETLNKKFNITISCEVFEHAKNWDKIFQSMYNVLKDEGVLIFTCASQGRLEHGTLRTNPGESPGTMSDYYRNLNKKDFTSRFDLKTMFDQHYFYYNYYSLDLCFIGIKSEKLIKLDLDKINSEVKKIKSETKTIFLKRLFYSSILSDKAYQNFRFFRRKIVNSFLKIFKKSNV